jgi:hypothetical protein
MIKINKKIEKTRYDFGEQFLDYFINDLRKENEERHKKLKEKKKI